MEEGGWVTSGLWWTLADDTVADSLSARSSSYARRRNDFSFGIFLNPSLIPLKTRGSSVSCQRFAVLKPTD
jgi:hypothetical protein